MNLDRAYIAFYLDGRDERLLKHDIDAEELAKKVLDGKGSIHAVTLAAATEASTALVAKKRQWCRDHDDEIQACGGDADKAHAHYVQGKIDEVVDTLEPTVLEEITATLDEDDDEEDEGDEGGDDDDDDDEDDDDQD